MSASWKLKPVLAPCVWKNSIGRTRSSRDSNPGISVVRENDSLPLYHFRPLIFVFKGYTINAARNNFVKDHTLRNVSTQIKVYRLLSEQANPGRHIPSQGDRDIQQAKRVCPDQTARHAQADPSRYFTQCWFSRETADILCYKFIMEYKVCDSSGSNSTNQTQ